MDDWNQFIKVLSVPQVFSCSAHSFPIKPSVCLDHKLAHDLSYSHCEVSTNGVDLTEVVLGNHILTSREWAEADHTVKALLSIKGSSAKAAKLGINCVRCIVEIRFV